MEVINIETFKIGDIVARKSYKMDILFKIKNINKEIADLVGVTTRIVADAYIYDLVKITNEEKDRRVKLSEYNNRNRINRSYRNLNRRFNIRELMNIKDPNIYSKESIMKKPGIILHIDGDEDYAEKCKKTYKNMGIIAYVYAISEEDQPKFIINLLEKIKPNILIITGHDSFYRKKNDIYNINNYKNSKYFVQSVIEARKFEHNLDNLVIFAGACQSYYEAIISAGANFASAPKRVLIDMSDPLVVAQAIAFTPVDRFIPLENIIANTREGISGIGGIQTRGQYREGMPGI